MCLGHRREKLSSVNEQPARRGERCHPIGGDRAFPAAPRRHRDTSACRVQLRPAKTQDISRHCRRRASPATPVSGGLKGCGAAGPGVWGCQGTPRPHPRGRAHLCRRRTRSGRRGDTPSGSSPRWLPLAGSSSTSSHAPGNREQGRREMRRDKRESRGQSPAREQSTPTPSSRDAVPLAPPFTATHKISAVHGHARGFYPPYRSPGWHRAHSHPPRGRGEGT